MSNVKRLSKEERRSRRIRRGICIGAIVALLLTAGVLLLRRQVTQSFASGKQEILSAEVTTGSISATVSGSGSLVSADVTEVTVPAGVSIKKVYTVSVKEGEKVVKPSLSPAPTGGWDYDFSKPVTENTVINWK